MKHSESETYQLDFTNPRATDPAEERPIPQNSVFVTGHKVEVTPLFSAYWRFAVERQNIFFKRLGKTNANNLTTDLVMAQYKFTNAYRASDRVSQFLIRNVIYWDDLPRDDKEVFFRILLFKLFNKIETWEFLEETFGSITCREFDVERYATALTKRKEQGERIYSAAYIMPSGGSAFREKAKHKNQLLLLKYMLQENFPVRVRDCESMADAFLLMLSAPSIGPFLAYQFVTDLNYSELTNFSESEFVVAGPGARDGISKCFRSSENASAEDLIKYMFDNQDRYFSVLSLDFQSLWGRALQLIDCQNIFCEISKYARVAFPELAGVSNRKRIKQKFVTRGALPAPWYPPKWQLNSKIRSAA